MKLHFPFIEADQVTAWGLFTAVAGLVLNAVVAVVVLPVLAVVWLITGRLDRVLGNDPG